jgi:hypothetical protein
MRHLQAILTTAVELGRPELFTCDLDVDRETCVLMTAETAFLWILGREGTRMIVPDAGRGGCESDRIVLRATCLVDCRYYWWDGDSLAELSDAEEACFVLSNREADLRCFMRIAIQVA